MRNIRYTLVVAALVVALGSRAQGIEGVLQQIEQNNLSLRAHSSLTEARSLDARTANQLSNPHVQYVHAWGTPAEAGKNGELVATQSFDFPTAYARRAQMAKMQRSHFTADHALVRQQTLLEAKQLCIDLIALRRQKAVADERAQNAERIAEVYGSRLEAGKGTIIEKNRADMELTAARNAVSMIEIEIEAAENRLRTLNGGVEIEFADTEYAPLAELMPLAEMEALYADRDPSLLVAASQVEIAEQSVKVERAKTLPQFTVGYKLAHSTGQHFNGVVVGMSVPIFSGYRNTRAAKAQAAYAEAEHLSAVNDVRTSLAAMYERVEVLERSIAEYRSIEAEMSDYRSYLARAIEAGQISIIDYYSSLSNYYDVLSARIDFERQLQQVHAQINSVML